MILGFDREGHRVGVQLELIREWEQLYDKNLPLWAMVKYAAQVAEDDYRKVMIITDVWRDDENSVHHYWRGVDCRIAHPDRGISDDSYYYGLTYREAQAVCVHINEVFGYDNDHECAVIHGDGLNCHIHFQTKDTTKWSMG